MHVASLSICLLTDLLLSPVMSQLRRHLLLLRPRHVLLRTTTELMVDQDSLIGGAALL